MFMFKFNYDVLMSFVNSTKSLNDVGYISVHICNSKGVKHTNIVRSVLEPSRKKPIMVVVLLPM